MLIRNVREYGLEIAATEQWVEPGETVEVADDLGRSLLEQPANWAPAVPVVTDRPADSASKRTWVAYAVHVGLDEDEANGLTRAELIERLPAVTVGERPDDADPGVQIPDPVPVEGATNIDVDPDATDEGAALSGEED